MAPCNTHYVQLVLSVAFVITGTSKSICPLPCTCENNGFVNCSQRGLSRIPSGIPSNTIHLDLSQNLITLIRTSAIQNLVNLSSIDVSANSLSDDQIQDGAFELPLLETIDLSYSNLKELPGKLLPKSLKTLYIVNSHMTSVPSDSFRNTRLLENLYLSSNNISVITSGLFDHLPNLQTIDVSFNELTDEGVSQMTFNSNVKLLSLNLRFNKLTHILTDLPNSLLHLDYVGNNIKTIPSYCFKSLSNLQTLELWQGQVTTLEDNAFDGLTKLEFLFMTQDRVNSDVTNNTFYGLNGLKKLYLDFNNVSIIAPYAFKTLKSIEAIFLTNNTISRLEPEVLDIQSMPHLSAINLDGNPWYCDCHLRWLKQRTEQAPYIVTNPELLVCSGPPSLAGRSWDTLKIDDFVCP